MHNLGQHEFRIPPVIITGPGSIARLKDLTAGKGTTCLLISDQGMRDLGHLEKAEKLLAASGCRIVCYDRVNSEPTTRHVEEGFELYRENRCDFLVALGGGSPIDAAKGIALVAANPGRISDYMGINRVENNLPPLIAIPTTAGTGSEVTRFTIITNLETGTKMLIGSPLLIPGAAVIDAELTLSKPAGVTAFTGIDALTHAIEAYISKKAQPLADSLALSAIGRIARHLKTAWEDGSNLEARNQVMLASTEAGMAFSNSSVTLVHGMSRPLGAVFHLPHGLSNALLLVECLKYLMPASREKLLDIAAAMEMDVTGLTFAEGALKAIEAVEDLCEVLQVPTLESLGLVAKGYEDKLSKMAEDALASGSPANSPGIVDKAAIIDIYRRVASA